MTLSISLPSQVCLKVKVAQTCLTLCNPVDWNSSGQNTGVGSLFLLQWIFPTQGSNTGLHCRQILAQLSHKGSSRILEWVGYPFSSGSSWPRNWTGVSGIAGGFFTNWAIREALIAILIKISQFKKLDNLIMYIRYVSVTILKLITYLLPHSLFFFLVVRTHRIYPLSKF